MDLVRLMANPALIARTAAQIRWPGAVVVERGRGYIKHRHPTEPNRFMLDTQVGGIGWHYGPLLDQEVDTAWQPGVAPWQYQMVKAEFNAFLLSRLDAGMVGRYTDPNTGEYVEFDPQNLQWTNDLNQIQPIGVPQNVNAVISDDLATWPDGYGTGRHFSWQAQTARFEKLLTIDSLVSLPTANATIRSGGNPALELQLTFRRSAGVGVWVNGTRWDTGGHADRVTSGLVEFRLISTGQVLWWFNLPRSWDSNGESIVGTFWFKRQGQALNVFHRIPLSWIEDPTRVWPIRIDVTVDVQVGASADDGRRYTGSAGFSEAETASNVGYSATSSVLQAHIFARWVGVTIEGIIDANSYIQCYQTAGPSGSAELKVYGVDEDNPAAPTTAAEFDADALTTATVDWDGAWTYNIWNQSPSLASIFQELVDTYTISNKAIMVQIKNDHAASGYHYNYPRMWDHTGNLHGPKLHIEYTAEGATVTLTATMSSSGAIVRQPGKLLAGSVSSSGLTIKQDQRILMTSLTSSASLLVSKLLTAILLASLSFTGAVSQQVSRLLAAGLSFSGALSEQIALGILATLTASASLAKQGSLSLLATLTFTGLTFWGRFVSLAGGLSFAGSLLKQGQRLLAATLDFAGALSFPGAAEITLTATLTAVGTVGILTQQYLLAVLSFSAVVGLLTGLSLTGSLSFVGNLIQLVSKNLAATLTSGGTLAQTMGRNLAATLTLGGVTLWGRFASLTATLSFVGQTVLLPRIILAATLSFGGSVIQQVQKVLTATLSFVSSLSTGLPGLILITLIATLSFSGAVTKQIGRVLAGALDAVGAWLKWVTRRGVPTVTLSTSQTGTLALSNTATATLGLTAVQTATVTLSATAYTP